MAKKKKKKNGLRDRINNWRQKQYLRIGVVMLPDRKTERKAALDLIKSGQYEKEENA